MIRIPNLAGSLAFGKVMPATPAFDAGQRRMTCLTVERNYRRGGNDNAAHPTRANNSNHLLRRAQTDSPGLLYFGLALRLINVRFRNEKPPLERFKRRALVRGSWYPDPSALTR
jgi:hypothetical protein